MINRVKEEIEDQPTTSDPTPAQQNQNELLLTTKKVALKRGRPPKNKVENSALRKTPKLEESDGTENDIEKLIKKWIAKGPTAIPQPFSYQNSKQPIRYRPKVRYDQTCKTFTLESSEYLATKKELVMDQVGFDAIESLLPLPTDVFDFMVGYYTATCLSQDEYNSIYIGSSELFDNLWLKDPEKYTKGLCVGVEAMKQVVPFRKNQYKLEETMEPKLKTVYEETSKFDLLDKKLIVVPFTAKTNYVVCIIVNLKGAIKHNGNQSRREKCQVLIFNPCHESWYIIEDGVKNIVAHWLEYEINQRIKKKQYPASYDPNNVEFLEQEMGTYSYYGLAFSSLIFMRELFRKIELFFKMIEFKKYSFERFYPYVFDNFPYQDIRDEMVKHILSVCHVVESANNVPVPS